MHPTVKNESECRLLYLGKSNSSIIGDATIILADLSMHMAVLGESGFGKTTFVTDLLAQIWEADPSLPWLVFDLKGATSDSIAARAASERRTLASAKKCRVATKHKTTCSDRERKEGKQ